jgi:hypothetical protein
MRYYVTARSAEDKQSLLGSLTGVIDTEPMSLRNILVDADAIEKLANDPRIQDIQPHPEDWPGFEYRLFAE